jgi:hypothetical protein
LSILFSVFDPDIHDVIIESVVREAFSMGGLQPIEVRLNLFRSAAETSVSAQAGFVSVMDSVLGDYLAQESAE